MAQTMPIIFVVDDNPAVCETLDALIRPSGCQSKTFASADELMTFLTERSAYDEGLQSLRARYSCLTLREREIMTLVASGLLNKQIAVAIERSEITVKAHRGHVMRKMDAGSFAELVRMAFRLGLPPDVRSRYAGIDQQRAIA
jgi:FixJ family two-component response regulator